MERITEDSTDYEIWSRINQLGLNPTSRIKRRKHDRPGPGELHYWVKTGEIGPSSTHNTRLLRRLKEMTERGILEMDYHGYLPRFRALLKPDRN